MAGFYYNFFLVGKKEQMTFKSLCPVTGRICITHHVLIHARSKEGGQDRRHNTKMFDLEV